jgi:predicted Zn-dependent protease
VVQLDPEQDEARSHMGALLVQLSKGEEALPHLEYLYQLQPDTPIIAVQLAKCRYQLGQPAAAEATLKDLLARWPDYPPALTELGRLAQQAGRFGEAEELLRKAARLQPGDQPTQYLYSQLLMQSGKTAEAKEVDKNLKQIEADVVRMEELLNGKLENSPHDPGLLFETGMIAIRAGVVDDGVRWLESALKEDPKYAPAHKSLAIIYRQSGDLARSSRHLELARQAEAASQIKPVTAK